MKRSFFHRATALAAALLLLGTLASCKKEKQQSLDEQTPERISYETLVLSEYVAPLSYTDLTVPLTSEDASRADTIWEYLYARVEILKYPQEAIDYYVAQKQSVYRLYADEHDLSYEQVLKANGVSEEGLLTEAKAIVKSDLLYLYIAEDANITLSDTEKQTLFDRYVQKYKEQYGYTEEYIKEHMEELIHESMLYDKVREYLMLHNEFVTQK